MALEHYREVSEAATHFNSVIPKAIEFYKQYAHQPALQGKRKIVYTPGKLLEALEAGWVFDPWLNSRGSPIIVGDQPYKGEHPALSAVDPREPSIYWVLVKGTPEQIAGLKPFVELPEEEEAVLEPELRPYGLSTLFIPHDSEEKPPDDYVVMHKDHIFAKGTVYTKPPEKKEGQ